MITFDHTALDIQVDYILTIISCSTAIVLYMGVIYKLPKVGIELLLGHFTPVTGNACIAGHLTNKVW